MTDSKTLVVQAKQYLEQENYEEAYRLILEAVHLDGNPEALVTLGDMYMNGDYVNGNYFKAGHYYAEAYENGGQLSGHDLIYAGCSCEAKSNDPKDRELAKKYYKLAGDIGTKFGYEGLAEILISEGKYEETYEYLLKSEYQNILGLYYMGYIYEKGLAVDKDVQKAIEFYKKAVDKASEYESRGVYDDHARKAKERLKALGEM